MMIIPVVKIIRKRTNMKCKSLFCVVLLLTAFAANAQNATSKSPDTSKVNAMLREIKAVIGPDPARGLEMAKKAKELSEKINYPLGVATASKWIGNATYYLGQPQSALLIWEDALKMFEAAHDKVGQADLLGNIGVIYYLNGDKLKALQHHLQSLKIAESINYKSAMLSALNNIGGVYYMKEETYDKALQYYLKALPIGEALNKKEDIGTINVNIGNIYMKRNEDGKAVEAFHKSLKAFAANSVQLPNVYISLGKLYLKQNNYPKALQNYHLALAASRNNENQLNISRSLIGEAGVYAQKGDYKKAIDYFKEGEKIVVDLNAVLELEGLYGEMANAYAKTGDYANAYKYVANLIKVKDELYNINTEKNVASLQFDFDLQQKQSEINLLTKDKSIKELELKKQATFRNGLTIVLGLIAFLAFILFRGYRNKAKHNVILDRKNLEIERLLLNILPAEVAHELRTTGKATPRNYEHVSVMFTDFRGFTTLADKMTPQELVTELGNCFMEFDNIIEKHGLEKIKTIGDAYMCAGGIPTPGEKHIFRMVKASLEIQRYIYQKNQKRNEEGLAPWDIRIGIHIGPVVAGVVGKKKYAYDIWGSTVNIASRMESNGIPGHVNVSSAVYNIIKDDYTCTYRGKIHAKNIGEIDMYLVDHNSVQFEEALRFEANQRSATGEATLTSKLFE